MSEAKPRGLSIRSVVIVEVYSKDGKLKKRVVQPANLVLNNFLYFVRLMFGGVAKQAWGDIGPFTDEDGKEVHLTIGYTSDCWDYAANADKKFFVECGTDSTPPSGTDYSLKAKLAEGTASIQEVNLSASPPYIKVGGYIDIPSNASVWEIGLSLECWAYDTTTGQYGVKRILLFRDVLSESLDVYGGDRIEVTYQINIQR